MKELLTSEEMRAVDASATKQLGIPALLLMEHAAIAVVNALQNRFTKLLPESRGIVVAGPGNNGADALAVARLLYERGARVIITTIGEKTSELFKMQQKICKGLGIKFEAEPDFEKASFIVDGIFGTGLSRELSPSVKKLIEKINTAKCWVVSIDIPSGLNSDNGQSMGAVVRASETVTLGFLKRGLVTGHAADFVGKLTLADIQIPKTLAPKKVPHLFEKNDAVEIVPSRPKSSNKGTFGHAFIYLGDPTMEGATVLASSGALHSGVGLVTVLGSEEGLSRIKPRLPPECLTKVWSKNFTFPEKSALCFGPGLGIVTPETLTDILKVKVAMVIDADGLNSLAGHNLQKKLRERSETTVLTPHPKEAARLLGVEVDEIERDRFEALSKLVKLTGQNILLKGKGTLLGFPKETPIVVAQGNTGLSKGGTGDVLSGLLTGLLAQGLPPKDALPLATYLHGRTSEILAEEGKDERTLLPSDISDNLSKAFRELEK